MVIETLCVSHTEDVDGLICAAYLQHLKDATILLIDYDEFESTLRSVTPPVKEVFICDLNVREEQFDDLQRISQFARITLVDHHSMPFQLRERLGRFNIKVIYSLDDCASVLLFDYFHDRLDRKAARLAAYAAISDQFEDGPIARNLLSWFDRQFIQHEALLLTHALNHEPTPKYRMFLVKELSAKRFPHRIMGIPKAALEHLEHCTTIMETLHVKATQLGRLAYIESQKLMSIGSLAGLLLDAMDVDVGLCYQIGNIGSMNVSIRGRKGIKFHLGEITKNVAKRNGGFGGGHTSASGASIPKERFENFIKELGQTLES